MPPLIDTDNKPLTFLSQLCKANCCLDALGPLQFFSIEVRNTRECDDVLANTLPRCKWIVTACGAIHYLRVGVLIAAIMVCLR